MNDGRLYLAIAALMGGELPVFDRCIRRAKQA